MTIVEEIESLRREMDIDETLRREADALYYAKRRSDGDRLGDLIDKRDGVVRKKKR